MDAYFTAEEIRTMRVALAARKRAVSFSDLPQVEIENAVKELRSVDAKLAALAPQGA